MEEESPKETKPIDWSEPHPIDDRDHSWDEDADLREVTLSEEDIDQIERELRVEVPAILRGWLLDNPFEGFIDEPPSLTPLRDYLIGFNVKLRREGYYGREWPSSLLWIGSDGGFGAYYVESGDPKSMVHWYDWEQGKGSVVNPEYSETQSPEEFMKEMIHLNNNPDQ